MIALSGWTCAPLLTHSVLCRRVVLPGRSHYSGSFEARSMTRSVLCYRVVELKLRGRFQLTYRQPAHDHGGSSMPGRASSHRVLPRALRPGDTVGVVAPAGPVADRSGVEAGAARLERL